MSSSRHKIQFPQPLREVRVRKSGEALVSETRFRELLEERFRAGFEAGQKALGEQLVEQRKQLLDLQNGVLRSIQQALPSVIAECEESVVLLAIESAKRVLGALPITSQVVESTVKQGLAELQQTAEYEVRLHPEDLSLLEKAHSGVLPAPENKDVKFTPDSSILRGGCMIQTRHGSIEATRDKMFEKLEAAVLC
ncbi:MAG TPA: FliH/SctL family protein [Verrucomicrobiae bacterium]|nr:FliH/SctL family protein [Verrucomicrobiae bacterium]